MCICCYMFYVMCPIYVYIIFFDAENNTDYNVKKKITIFIFEALVSHYPPIFKPERLAMMCSLHFFKIQVHTIKPKNRVKRPLKICLFSDEKNRDKKFSLNNWCVHVNFYNYSLLILDKTKVEIYYLLFVLPVLGDYIRVGKWTVPFK